MTNDDFEQFLGVQPLRPIPPEWRAQILQSTKLCPVETGEPHIPWWRELIWPSPLAWSGVGCAWLLILGMNFASHPSAIETDTTETISSQEIFTAITQERQLVQEGFQFEWDPPEPPRRRSPAGACNGRQPHHPTETA